MVNRRRIEAAATMFVVAISLFIAAGVAILNSAQAEQRPPRPRLEFSQMTAGLAAANSTEQDESPVANAVSENSSPGFLGQSQPAGVSHLVAINGANDVPTLGFSVFGSTIHSAIFPYPATSDPPQPFEDAQLPASEPKGDVNFAIYLANMSDANFTVKDCFDTGDVELKVRRLSDGKEFSFDPVVEMDKRVYKEYVGQKRMPAGEKNFVPLEPDKAVSPARFVTYANTGTKTISRRLGLDRKIPVRMIDRPGIYEVSATYENKNKLRWTGSLRSEAVRFEVLSTD